MSAVCLIIGKRNYKQSGSEVRPKKLINSPLINDRFFKNFSIPPRVCLRSSPSKSPFLKSHPSSSQRHQVLQSLHESKQIDSGWTFYRRICNVFSMIFFISEKWLISWNENFLFPIVVVNSQSNIVRGVPIGIPHSHISFTNSSSSLGHVTSSYTNLTKFRLQNLDQASTSKSQSNISNLNHHLELQNVD